MLLSVIVFVACLLIGVPIAFSLGVASIAFLVVLGGIPFEVVAQRMFNGLDSFPFMAIPFFILAGELMNTGGITKRLVTFSETLVGHMKGGLAHVNIITSMFFAGITGSAIADTSAIGSMLIPAMEKEGYDADFSAAVTASASVMGPIIPPSIPFVIFSLLSGTSVAALFLAGVIPGVLLAAGLMLVTYIIARKRNYPKRPGFPSIRAILRAFVPALIPLMMPLIILGGILGGIVTATEASGIAVVYGLVIGFLVYRNISLRQLLDIFLSTAKTVGIVFLVIACSNVFNWMLTVAQVPQTITSFVSQSFGSRALLLLAINIVLLFFGTFMEGTAAMIITVPILMQMTGIFGINPVMLGAIVVLNLMIGLITPPVGLCLFVACGIAKITLEKLVKAIWPFLVVEVVVLFLVTYIEPISLFLPRLFGYIR